MKVTKIKGTLDYYGNELNTYRFIEKVAQECCNLNGIKEVMLPTFEATELFARGVGEGSDIVSKEMYTFLDRSSRSITLRPEGTAGVTRWFVENKMYINSGLSKYFYIGPMFRYERPQAGRYREFRQFGVEIFGNGCAYLDADIIAFADAFLKKLGIKNVKVLINNIGSKASRENYEKVLVEYFKNNIDEMCSDCKNRLVKNPLRILDCKVDKYSSIMKNAPKISDYLIDEDKKYSIEVVNALEALGIKYEVDQNLVRGLDYYTSTVFEFVYDDPSSPINGLTLLAGGRYNGLTKELDGPEMDAIGFATGIERLILVMNELNISPKNLDRADVCVITIGESVKLEGIRLANYLKNNGLRCEIDYLNNNLKPQFKLSYRVNAKYILIIGEDELNNDLIKVKNIDLKTEEIIKVENILEIFNKEGEKYAYKK